MRIGLASQPAQSPPRGDRPIRGKRISVRQPLAVRVSYVIASTFVFPDGSRGKDLAPHAPEGLAWRAHPRHPRRLLRTFEAALPGLPVRADAPHSVPTGRAVNQGAMVAHATTHGAQPVSQYTIRRPGKFAPFFCKFGPSALYVGLRDS